MRTHNGMWLAECTVFAGADGAGTQAGKGPLGAGQTQYVNRCAHRAHEEGADEQRAITHR